MGIHEGYQVVQMAFVFDPILHFLSFFVCVCIITKGSGETARKRRLVKVFGALQLE